MPIRILLVEDNQTFALAVRLFLQNVPETEVIAQAGTGREALVMAERLQPDVALLDISLPGISGLEVAREMRTWARSPLIIFLSMHDGASYRATAQELGAIGFVSKTHFVSELLPILDDIIAQRDVVAPV